MQVEQLSSHAPVSSVSWASAGRGIRAQGYSTVPGSGPRWTKMEMRGLLHSRLCPQGLLSLFSGHSSASAGAPSQGAPWVSAQAIFSLFAPCNSSVTRPCLRQPAPGSPARPCPACPDLTGGPTRPGGAASKGSGNTSSLPAKPDFKRTWM